MGVALLSDLAAEVFIPAAAVVGIVFAVVQWALVSRVKISPERQPATTTTNTNKNGYSDYLIEEEEGLNDHNVVIKCAEIQSAISEGLVPSLFLFSVFVGFGVALLVIKLVALRWIWFVAV